MSQNLHKVPFTCYSKTAGKLTLIRHCTNRGKSQIPVRGQDSSDLNENGIWVCNPRELPSCQVAESVAPLCGHVGGRCDRVINDN